MRKLFREPLLHFLILGFALFLLFDVVSGGRGGADRRIVVNETTVAAIVQRHQSVWKRAPTPAELRRLIDAQVREEILFREGVAMGLDRDDPVIRRRVQQKLDVLSEESAGRSAPTEAELQEYLGRHRERYALATVVGFDQVMFDPARYGAGLDAALAAAMARLRAGADPNTVGDPSLLPVTIGAVGVDRLAREFGEEFARSVVSLAVGEWSGPVASGYGAHLVRVNSRTPGRPATLDEVRVAVERDWESARRVQAKADYFETLRRKYEVVISADLPRDDEQGANR